MWGGVGRCLSRLEQQSGRRRVAAVARDDQRRRPVGAGRVDAGPLREEALHEVMARVERGEGEGRGAVGEGRVRARAARKRLGQQRRVRVRDAEQQAGGRGERLGQVAAPVLRQPLVEL